jgi:hypothetical protein
MGKSIDGIPALTGTEIKPNTVAARNIRGEVLPQ